MVLPSVKRATRALAGWFGRLTLEAAPRPYRAVRAEIWFLASICVLALGLRVLGLRLGLPYLHHWDERYIVDSARSMIEQDNAVPLRFVYGAPLMRLTAWSFRVAEALGLELAQRSDFEVALRWTGRSVAVLIASSGAPAVYLATRMAARSGVAALFAALCFACAAELVWHSRYLVTDASVVALTAWTVALSAAYLEKRTILLGALAVVAAGLTSSFKLTGLAVLGLPVAALLLRRPYSFFRPEAERAEHEPRWLELSHRLLLAGAVPIGVAIFAAQNPYLISEWKRSLPDLARIMQVYREGHVKPVTYREADLEHLGSALWFLGAQAFSTNAVASLAVAAVSVVGLGVGLRRAEPIVVLAVLHAALIVLGMALPNRAFLTRMYLPALVALCVGFGIAIDWGLGLASRWPKARPAVVAGGLAVALVVPALYVSARCQALADDTRVRAVDFVANVAQGSKRTLSVAFTPTVARRGPAWGVGHDVERYLVRSGIQRAETVADARAAEQSGADYVIVASYRDDRKISPVTILPWDDDYPFERVPGYVEIARFEPNPYEERFDILPTWYGRVTSLVLERKR